MFFPLFIRYQGVCVPAWPQVALHFPLCLHIPVGACMHKFMRVYEVTWEE